MNADLTRSIVRILDPAGNTHGTGFVVHAGGDSRIVTCAHVVKLAKSGPGQSIALTFSPFNLVRSAKKYSAMVEQAYWRDADAEDIAILHLEEPFPRGVEPLRLGSSLGSEDHVFQSYGFGAAKPEDGLWGKGTVRGLTSENGFPVWQMDSSEVSHGFSGAPVWDKELQVVVGMVTSIARPDRAGRQTRANFVIPAETLSHVCPRLPITDECPYRGLSTFTEEDRAVFFGREQAIKELLKKLGANPQFLAVFGPSGSGKSSLVRAGLIPRLQEDHRSQRKDWGVIVTRPSDNPFKQLSDQGLDVEPGGLLGGVCGWLKRHPDKQRLLLIIDQFEELFVTCPEAQRGLFIKQLTHLRNEPFVTVIIIMRNDFYSQFVEHEALREWLAMSGGTTDIPQTLKRNALLDIILKPAERYRLRFQEALADLIIRDVMEESSHPSDEDEETAQCTVLPLLEFVLTQLWEQRQQGVLTSDAYRAIGGVAGGLTQWANQVLARLGEERRPLVERVFLALVHLGDETSRQPDSRQPASLASLTTLSRNDSERAPLQHVIQELVNARLLVIHGDIQRHEATIEIIHEALLQHWSALKHWIADNRPFLAWHQSFEERVLEWERRKRPKHLLYSSVQLKEAERWTEHKRLSEQEVAFLRASTTQRNLSLIGLILAVLLLISSAGVAGWFALTRPADPTLVTMLQDSVGGSLRYCIDNAPSGSTIRFAPGLSGTIKLTGGGLAIAGGKQLTIVGPGAKHLTISGGNTDAIIHVSKGAKLDISGLSFKNSQTVLNAFLFNEGTLTVSNSIISDNKTTTGGISFGGGVGNGGASLGGGILNSNTGILTVKNSVISNNSAVGNQDGQGGGIYNDGKLTVIQIIFSNNVASGSASNDSCRSITHGGVGGGIDNHGELIVVSSTFSNNKAIGNDSGCGVGGGIFNHRAGTLTVTNSTFSGNSASSKQDYSSGGGGIWNDGKFTVVNSTFSNNSASSQNGNDIGGGIANEEGTLTVTNSTFSGNSASGNQGGSGGGIDNQAQLTITHSTFINNSASSNGSIGMGGGIDNGSDSNTGTLTVSESSFSGNSASGKQGGQGGGIDNAAKLAVVSTTFSNNSVNSDSYGLGGGIFNGTSGTLTVSNCTFSDNKASGNKEGSGGGIENDGSLTVTVSTIVHNSASGNQDAFGGGIDNYGSSSSVIIRFCTIYSNMSKEGGGIWTDPTHRNQMNISSSIIAANSANSAQNGPDISGSLISGGYNLLQNFAGVTGLNATTDRQVTLSDLKLDSILRNNGGPIQTLALLQGSPAIDAVPREACSITIKDPLGHRMTITTDQRGNRRPDASENACDIGAYESSY